MLICSRCIHSGGEPLLNRLAAVGWALRWVLSIITRSGCLAGHACKNAIEHTKPAPSDEAVVEGLVRTVVARRIAPGQAALEQEDDAPDDAPLIHSRRAMRQRKVRLDALQLRL